MTPEHAARLAGAVDAGECRIRIVNSDEEERAARAEGWSDNYEALPAVAEQRSANSIAAMCWQFAAKWFCPAPFVLNGKRVN